MTKKEILKDKEYYKIIKDLYERKEVQTLDSIPHHDTGTRLEHSLNVSYKAYKIAKKHNLDYKSTAKAGLLHDLYFNRIAECKTKIDKIKLLTNGHPVDAIENASKFYELNKLEKDIIKTHMWPISIYMPKYKESFIVGYADKYCSFFDAKKKVKYKKDKLVYRFGVYVIMFMLTIF